MANHIEFCPGQRFSQTGPLSQSEGHHVLVVVVLQETRRIELKAVCHLVRNKLTFWGSLKLDSSFMITES